MTHWLWRTGFVVPRSEYPPCVTHSSSLPLLVALGFPFVSSAVSPSPITRDRYANGASSLIVPPLGSGGWETPLPPARRKKSTRGEA